MKEKNTKNNGAAALGSPTLIFARAFRFGFKTEHLSEHFVRKVHINHKEKQLYLEIYQIYGEGDETPFYHWQQNWDDEGTLICYDGCGDELSKTTFSGLQLLSHREEYDYASSDVATNNVTLSYQKETRVCCYARNKMPKVHMLPKGDEGKLTWKLAIGDKEYVVEDQKRPNLVVEEIEIPYKNTTVWIPGRAKWESASFKIITKETLDDLHKTEKAVLRLYIGDKLLEEWYITDIMTNRIDRHGEGEINWVVRFASVSYRAI